MNWWFRFFDVTNRLDNFIVENSSNYPAAVVAAAVTAAPESNYAGCHHYLHSENLVSVNMYVQGSMKYLEYV